MDTENSRENGLEHGVNKKITRRTLLLIAGAATLSVIGIGYKMGLFEFLFEETTTPPESEGSEARYTVTPEPTPTIIPEPTPTPYRVSTPPPQGPQSTAEVSEYMQSAVDIFDDPRRKEDPYYYDKAMAWRKSAVYAVAENGFSDEYVIALYTPIDMHNYHDCYNENKFDIERDNMDMPKTWKINQKMTL